MAETPYIEANIVLAFQAGEVAEALDLIRKLLPGERVELAEACEQAAGYLRDRNT